MKEKKNQSFGQIEVQRLTLEPRLQSLIDEPREREDRVVEPELGAELAAHDPELEQLSGSSQMAIADGSEVEGRLTRLRSQIGEHHQSHPHHVVSEVIEEPIERVHEVSANRHPVRDRSFDEAIERIGLGADCREEERFFGAEVVIERRLRAPTGLGHLAHRGRRVSAFPEEPCGLREDAVAQRGSGRGSRR